MGTDIHWVVEVFRDVEEEPAGWLAVSADNTNLPPRMTERNYDVFARLADVRSRDGAHPIASHQELPWDCSEFVRKKFAGWKEDGSWSPLYWVTLEELYQYSGWNINCLRFLNTLTEFVSDLHYEKDSHIRLYYYFDS